MYQIGLIIAQLTSTYLGSDQNITRDYESCCPSEFLICILAVANLQTYIEF